MKTLSTKQTGNLGEDIACQYLKKHGYKILERNFRIRGGEIDIVCKDGEYLAFVEVKTRYSHEYGLPIESMTSWKIKALLKTALFYVRKINWEDKGYRLDLVTVDFANDPEKPEIELIKDITS
ncbi:YraN family protein [Candidatus Daviesbacteria bacterium RIFCSPHIGHO2_02_FULL_39_12]|uniref:UPF0102 protein A3C26_01850 n=2 Tax=Candidatus Daviesiibacteriota TaxID=1752718 RepID=A0A1F5JD70_9BACT|nr:MAG: YraN family protein [Candidatus Daviesbacteria bacterium RIFCSPHIGHO2_02_FULL_39_12]OGE71523.1 MAG: YraN family protein [Candidatus Daviesbacteria bacterium RIFCSPLOWO2_02_FULL_38_15]